MHNNEIKSAALTHQGMRRANNEDGFLCNPGLGLFMAADGMGGANCGETASKLTLEYMEAGMTPYLTDLDTTAAFENRHNDPILNALAHTVESTNKALVQYADQHPHCRGMGSTLTACVVQNNFLYMAHIGDSRLYCRHDSHFFQLSEDHTRVRQLLIQQIITEEEARNHPQRHIITQCVGLKQPLTPQLCKHPLIPDAVYLLCSDGLYDMLSDSMIIEILDSEKSLSDMASILVLQANQRGGRDNITVVLFQQKPGDGG